MPFKCEVDTGERSWSSNAARFRTRKEADAAGRELSWRWMAVRAWRAAPTPEPVNCRFDFKANHIVWPTPEVDDCPAEPLYEKRAGIF